MADYDYDEPRRYRSTRTRPRDAVEPEYVRETTYVERGNAHGTRDLATRPRREDSVEEIPRDRIPRGYDDYDAPPRRRARSVGRRGGYYDDDDRYDDYAVPAAAGAAGGYHAARGRDRRDRDGRSDRGGYHSDHSPRREHKKSGIEEALAGLGLGGLLGGAAANRTSSRDRHGDRRRDSRSRSRSRGGGDKPERKWAQAAQAALVAGAIEAFKSRKEAGPWTGEKGQRIATAALSAGGIDGLLGRDPNDKTKLDLAGAVLGGLATTRLAKGAPDDGREGRARSRSRSIFGRGLSSNRRPGSRSPSGDDNPLKKLAAGGALAAAGKAIYDRVRSKSRRRRSPSSSSSDSYVPSRRRGRDGGSRDRRVAAAGGGAAVAANREGKSRAGDNRSRSSSSSSSLSDLDERRKKTRTKEFLTAGLATIATIHAAHGVYASMEASDKRHKLVMEGDMSPEEARKRRTKAWLQDAAAVGIAALGIKGAYSEWKEMNEQRLEVNELAEKKKAREKKRRRRQEEEQRRQNGYGGYGVPPAIAAAPYGGPSAYADARPYSAGSLPPPPMGAGNGPRY